MKNFKDYPVSVNEVIRAKAIVSNFLRATELTYYAGLSQAIGAELS
jgi:hypothetical protein